MKCKSSAREKTLRGAFLKRIIRFSENSTENQSYEGAAVKQLIADSHGEVACPCLYPCAEIRFVEKHCGNQTHHRTHDTADADRDCKGNQLWSVIGAHHPKGESRRKFADDKKFQHKGNREHDWHFMQCGKKCHGGNTVCVPCNIVHNHTVYHYGCHDGGENSVLKFVFWHKKSS